MSNSIVANIPAQNAAAFCRRKESAKRLRKLPDPIYVESTSAKSLYQEKEVTQDRRISAENRAESNALIRHENQCLKVKSIEKAL